MKNVVKVNQETCIGCNMCVDICPELFRLNDEYKSECIVDEVKEDLKDKAKEACDVCPVSAITLEEQTEEEQN